MTFNKTLLAAGMACLSFNSFGAAFQLAEHSASGLGRAFAGEAAIADDASVVARNPALMAQFDKMVLTVSGSYISPDVKLEGTSTPYENIDPSDLNSDNIGPAAVIPAAYFVAPINDKVAIGFGVFSNFGLATEFDDDYAAGQIGGETSITTINFNANASYRVDENFTIAGGLNLVYADAELIRNFGESALPLPRETVAADLSGDDTSFGWNIGMAYEINDENRYGFSYRSEVDLAFEGEYSNGLPPSLGGLGGEIVPGYLDITLPAIMEFSGFHQVKKDVAVHYSIMWTGWSSLEKLEGFVDGSDAPVFAKEENFSNAMRYAIGATYAYNEKVTLRTGIAYDETPTDQDHLTISIPDTNRIWVSSGMNYLLDDNSSIDLGVTIVKGGTENFTETDDLGQEWGFETSGGAYIFAAQYNYAF